MPFSKPYKNNNEISKYPFFCWFKPNYLMHFAVADQVNLDKLNHYSIKNSNGHFDEYAAVPEQNITIPNNFSNFGSTPKSIIKKPIKPKTLIEANYDPFNKNYSAISSSRYRVSQLNLPVCTT